MASLTGLKHCTGITLRGEQCNKITKQPHHFGRCHLHYEDLLNQGSRENARAEYARIVKRMKRDFQSIFPKEEVQRFETNVVNPYLASMLKPTEPDKVDMTFCIAPLRKIFENARKQRTEPVSSGDRVKDRLVMERIRRLNELKDDIERKNAEEVRERNEALIRAGHDITVDTARLYERRVDFRSELPPAFKGPSPIGELHLSPANQNVARQVTIEGLKNIRRQKYSVSFHKPMPDTPWNAITEQTVSQHNDIHDRLVEKKIVKLIDFILRIEVPDDYRWNDNFVSRTFGEVISSCKLNIESFHDIASRYTSNEQMFVQGPGTYGRVMDSIWQFIKISPDRVDMINHLQEELMNTLGSCTQGAIGRLCNVVVGYIEDIIPPESSPTNLIRREFPEIRLNIDNPAQRLTRGKEILTQINIPQSEWNDYLTQLLN